MIKIKQLLFERKTPKLIFFSHPRLTYNTSLERFWVRKLKRKFSSAKIENPNTTFWTEKYFKYGEQAYLDLIENSALTIGLPLSSTELSDGVSQELQHSLKVGIPTYIIVNNKLKRITDLSSFKILSNKETEELMHKQGIHNLDNPV